jgi:hypothetical protein
LEPERGAKRIEQVLQLEIAFFGAGWVECTKNFAGFLAWIAALGIVLQIESCCAVFDRDPSVISTFVRFVLDELIFDRFLGCISSSQILKLVCESLLGSQM